jgi:hypothetical protein
MSAVENSAANILVCYIPHPSPHFNQDSIAQELPNVTPSAIRLDILVELIRGEIVID